MTIDVRDLTIPSWFLWLTGAFGTLFVSWAGWVTSTCFASQTQDQVRTAIVEYAPYTRDRAMILNKFEELDAREERLISAIERQEAEIKEMRLQIERLLVVKPADVYKKVEELERVIREQRTK